MSVTPEEVRNLPHVIPFTFNYRDLLIWLKELVSDTSLHGHFVYEAGPKFQGVGAARERVISEPHTADVWITLQRLIRERLAARGVAVAQLAHAFIAALQVYADKTLVAVKGQQAHPIR